VTSELDLEREVKNYLKECFRNRQAPQLNELAARLGISRFALSRLFRARYGISLKQCVDTLRVERAQRLLRRTRFSISAIARRSAFGTERNFTRVFLRATGMTPTTYRQRGGV